MDKFQSLDIETLSAAYRAGASPLDVVAEVFRRIGENRENPIWISCIEEANAMERARRLAADPKARTLPLYGIPFAVKDNIDVQGLDTTAACRPFAYAPARNATAVERLLAAGAICIGKTNLDQFATGLVGSRSPYGGVRNALHSAYISGGSSSGSAVAVALGQVSFALGTDTAGSGRVPAALNNIVGLKPSCGLVSTAGVVPACRSLDCVSIFAGSCADAEIVLDVVAGPDPLDAYSRTVSPPARSAVAVIGVPHAEQLHWFGDSEAPLMFSAALERLERLGARIVEVDITPFLDAGRLLYEGPWVAERHAAIRDFYENNAADLLPVTRQIIAGAEKYSAADAFLAQYRLAELKAAIAPVWQNIDALCLPTTATVYTVEDEKREPFKINSNLGLYTNFANLLDLSAIALPAALRASGLPFGISLVARAGSDHGLCRLGARFHESTGLTMGAMPWMPSTRSPQTGRTADLPAASSQPSPPRKINVAVVGAHLSGQPLNHQLTDRDATLIARARTAAGYQLFALPDSVPPKPGLMRSTTGAGASIEVEIWALGEAEFGSFVAIVPPPLGIGTLELADGSLVKGFICEHHAVQGAREITSFGGWRAYLQSLSPNPSTVT